MDATTTQVAVPGPLPNGHVNPEPTQSSGEASNPNSKTTEQPRQKRKKARRACLACQRAHLTCGDERPCQRCIKRGLEADCHDGMRKKAKYLHDAPNEALMPGAEQHFRFQNDKNDSPVEQNSNVATETDPATNAQHQQPFQQGQAVSYSRYPQNVDTSPQMSSQFQNQITYSPYGNQPSPMQTQVPAQPQMNTPMQNMVDNQPFETPIFDVNDPLFNFDVSGMNFGNHYGALEFGMLGQMSSAADGHKMQRNNSSAYDPPSVHSSTYVADSPEATNFLFNPHQSVQDFRGQHMQQGQPSDNWALLPNIQDQYQRNRGFVEQPNTYPMAGMSSLNVPGGTQANDPEMFGYYEQPISESSPMNVPQPPNPSRQRSSQALARQRGSPEPQHPGQDGPSPLISKKLDQLPPQPPVPQRLRDPSSIYSSVTKPYPYTTGFHTLTSILQHRFPSLKRLRIAQALASIRPSFISCTRNLTNDDLIFMEKCFQRQLWEYEDFIEAIGTPTIVCRRTGEVAYVAPEFCLMTGWDKAVLLGNAPNLNVNKASRESNSGTISASSRGGMNTPKIPLEHIRTDPTRPQPVFLAELLDEDSVVEFYEDFAKLAFADSKGSRTRPCKIVKYKTKDDQPNDQPQKRKRPKKRNPTQDISAWEKEDQQTYLRSLGDKEGKVECMFCWTVKRDVFDIPMMIVLNFLPMTDP